MTDGTETMSSGLVNVGGVAAHINPSGGDIARMMESAPDYRLRALQEGPESRHLAILRCDAWADGRTIRLHEGRGSLEIHGPARRA